MTNAICISRLYGSGGRAIGELLSKELNYKFYDSKLVDLAAQKGAIPLTDAKDYDEQALNPWLYTPSYFGFYTDDISDYSNPVKMFKLQAEVIREKALEGNSIFVGRSADAILEDTSNVNMVSIYIYAPEDWRIKRLLKTEGYKNEKEAFMAMRKIDKQRINYYNYNTGREYLDPVNYDLCVNSSYLGIKKTAQFLKDYINFIFKAT